LFAEGAAPCGHVVSAVESREIVRTRANNKAPHQPIEKMSEEAKADSQQQQQFSLAACDWIGFDLDHTLGKSGSTVM
jgi:hypothetical protein